MSLVFAYGSNLDKKQMLERCPSAKIVATATMRKAELAFAGYSQRWGGPVATFIPGRPTGEVPGLIYRISEPDLRFLDSCEGSPVVYCRMKVSVYSDETGKRANVNTYRLIHRSDELGFPSLPYLAQIARAYREFGFDRDMLARAAYGSD